MVRLRICGVDVSVSFWFFAVVAAFILMEQGVLAFYLLLPIAVHELGHLMVMATLGVGVRQVSLTAFGVDIRRNRGSTLGYGPEIAVCLGGALANLLFALCLHCLAFHSMRVMLLVATNLAVAIFNILPVSNLDGGQVVRLLCDRFLSPDTARLLSKITSILVLGLLCGLGIFLLLIRWVNLSLLVALLYLSADVLTGE